MDEKAVLEAIAELKILVAEKGIGAVNKDIEKILLILNGNSHPEEGMVFKVSELYVWMQRHTHEHEVAREKADKLITEKAKTLKTHRDEVISVIIRWLTPIVVYGIATWIAENAHLLF